MTDAPQSRNLTPHTGQVDAAQRRALLGHGAACLWLTGLSGSGKSTVARAVEAALVSRSVQAYVLDGDNIRAGLCRDLGFGPDDRTENIRRIGEVAKLFVDAGVVVVCAFISPYRNDREALRESLGASFIEVFLNPGAEVCEARDPKGLYARARAGEIASFTGVSAPYEAPDSPDLDLDTGKLSVGESVASLLELLGERDVL